MNSIHKIKIFALVEGRIIDKLSERISGTFIRIHFILKNLKKYEDIKLIYIPYEYKQKYSTDHYSRIHWCIDVFYQFIIPFLSLLIIVIKRPHFIYFSYPNVVYNSRLNIYLLKFSKRMGVKLLMYSHDWVEQSEIDGRGKNELLSKELEFELVKISDILVVASSKYPQYETVNLPGGFEGKEFENLKYKIHDGRFNISYTGSMLSGKGIDILVDAAIMLRKKYSYIKLLLFGEIFTLDNETKKKIEENDFIINKVVPRNKLINYFSEVDCFAYTYNPSIPYWNHHRVTKFFEYIGSEIPFIATKCEGLKMIADEKGFMWVNYSPKDFAEKLEYLLKNPEERMRLSMELHELKKENTWEKRADILYNIIKNSSKHIVKKRI